MKTCITLLLILITSLPWGLFAQEEEGGEAVTGFYRSMAIEDALMEQSLNFALEDDEMDYWKDQRNFEKSLKQKNYTAYKTYISHKRKSYLQHKQSCDIASEHGKGYNKQALFYTTQGRITASNAERSTENFRLTEETVASKHQ